MGEFLTYYKNMTMRLQYLKVSVDICRVMKKFLFSATLALALGVFFSSCEKKEQPIRLPQGDANVKQVMLDMGGVNKSDQIFYNLVQGQIVFTSKINSWELAFDASPAGYHIFINGGKQMGMFNTHKKSMDQVTTLPVIKDNEWAVDQDCGLPDSTAVGDWRTNSGDVYIVKTVDDLGEKTYKKVIFLYSDEKEYKISYADLESPTGTTISITKDPKYNWVYFSYDAKGLVEVEPVKETWDVVFTRYQHVYHELDNVTYGVSGVLLNPYKTTAAEDSTNGFDNITINNVATLNFSNFRDVIGFDWKYYDLGKTNHYIINQKKTFVVKTQNSEFVKLHFLGFENNGVSGYPSFEVQNLY